uniref:Uncharacterized protein n=1 Tax=Nelumbo nucifera TaxID=4432 RepID=A0A822XZ18_NELNU|nr:TPA_asm: hypothetical protein HUJ06_025498 [Nelumbo nucifera]
MKKKTFFFVWNLYIRLYTTCQQLRMICHREASLWLCRAYSTSSSTVTTVLQQKSLPSLLDGTHDYFMQHDVQELNRVLCEKLEDKMKVFFGEHNLFLESFISLPGLF